MLGYGVRGGRRGEEGCVWVEDWERGVDERTGGEEG